MGVLFVIVTPKFSFFCRSFKKLSYCSSFFFFSPSFSFLQCKLLIFKSMGNVLFIDWKNSVNKILIIGLHCCTVIKKRILIAALDFSHKLANELVYFYSTFMGLCLQCYLYCLRFLKILKCVAKTRVHLLMFWSLCINR